MLPLSQPLLSSLLPPPWRPRQGLIHSKPISHWELFNPGLAFCPPLDMPDPLAQRGRARHHPALYTILENRWIYRAVRTQGSGRGRREGGRGRQRLPVCVQQTRASCLWRSFEGCRQWQGREAGRPLRLSRFPQQDSESLRLAVLRVSVTLGFMVHQATPDGSGFECV